MKIANLTKSILAVYVAAMLLASVGAGIANAFGRTVFAAYGGIPDSVAANGTPDIGDRDWIVRQG